MPDPVVRGAVDKTQRSQRAGLAEAETQPVLLEPVIGRCRRCCLLAASLASGLRLRAGSAKPPIETVVRGWEARCSPPSTPARPPPSR